MISKMKKLTFLIYHQEYEAFLSQIRELGVIHVQERQAGLMNDDLQKSLSRRALYKDVLKDMSFKIKDKADETIHRDLPVDDLLNQYAELNNKIANLTQQLPSLDKEIAEMSVWGDFDWQTIRKLEKAGYYIQFYACSEREFNPKWGELCDIVPIDKAVGRLSFITVSREPVKLEIEPLRLPNLSLTELDSKKTGIQDALVAAKDELTAFCVANYNTLVQYNKELDGEIDLIKVRLDGEPQAEGAVMVMEGWVPVENEQPVKEYLDSSSVYYEIRDTQKGDNPPIKLKNNWFVKLYETLTSMYGMPSYTEFDPTPLIAPFFSLFFAFCLGDAGYGLVLIALGMILKKKMPDMKGIMNLVISLGIFTAIFGTVLGTFFGINIYEATWVPEGLKNFMVSGKVEVAGGTYDKQMILALGIGVVHTIVAMLIKALVQTSRFGFKNALGAWGWFLLIGFGSVIATFMFLNLIPQDISKWALIGIGGVAAIGIYLLNDLHRNVLVNIGAGVWDTYNMATGLMGDILSYMRLYALGLAGGMLGGVFNSLGLMVQEGIGGIPGWVVCCLILVLGHAFNIAMSCISAFVHPLRLNFVEYFKNSGYEGTGVLYNPFINIDKK